MFSGQASTDRVAERRAIRVNNAAKRAEKAEKLKIEGNACFVKGDYMGAADLYAQAINVHGPQPLLMSNLAAAYLKLELFDEAEWAATRALEYDTASVKARYRRAMARKALCRYKAAKQDLKYMLKEEPKNETAKRELQEIEALMKADRGLPMEQNDELPRNDDLPWPLLSDSETEDSKHLGNYTACRFYNHSGCSKGTQCTYSHAPDARSVRDEAGKNVCLAFLAGDCEHGSGCLYSHSRQYLAPQSWWDDPVQLQAANTLMPYVEDYADYDELHNLLLKHISARTYAALQVREAILFHLKRQISEVKGKISQRKTSTTPKAAAKKSNHDSERFVLVLSLDYDPVFSSTAHLFSTIEKKIKTIHIRSHGELSQALEYLDSSSIIGVLVTDIGITRREYASVLYKLVAYVRGGGTTVIGGLFSSFIRPLDFARFFKSAWGFDWKMGSYHRAVFSVNSSNEVVKNNPSLPQSYSMKTTHVDGIKKEMAVYLEGNSFQGEAPVVSASLGKGRLCFLGDVNGEEGSTSTILAMLNVLDQPMHLLDGADPPQTSCANQIAGTSASGPSKASASTSSHAENAPPGVVQVEPYARKFLLMLTSCEENILQQFIPDFMKDLRGRVEVVTALSPTGLSNARAVDLLPSQDLIGVFVAGVDILYPENAYLLSKVVEYSKNGGTVVFGWHFAEMVATTDFKPLFCANWGLNWDIAESAECSVKRNFHNVLFKEAKTDDLKLPKKTRVEGIHIKGITKEMAVYFPLTKKALWNPDKDIYTAAVVFTDVEKGKLGFIGSASLDGQNRDIIFTMLKLV